MGIVDGVKNICRRNSLRRNESHVETCFLPLGKASSYAAVIDVEDPGYDTCKTAIMNFFRSHNVNGKVFFQDFRQIGSEDRLITSIETTITKKDVNWFGKPSDDILRVMDELNPDIFLCLIKDPDFSMEYLVKTSRAKFKIGRKQMGKDLFDLVLNDPKGRDLSQLESFSAMKKFLERIQ